VSVIGGVSCDHAPPGPRGWFCRKGVQAVRTFKMILRRPSRPDTVRYCNRADAQIGDVVTVNGRPWVIVEREDRFELDRIERIICVPRTVRSTH